jgi:spore maturation protein CgeB
LGVEVLPLNVDRASGESQNTLRVIKEFKPNFITAPNFNYFLSAVLSEKDLFNFSEVPVVALWDDPLGALALHLNEIMRTEGGNGAGILFKKIERVFKAPIGTLSQRFRWTTSRSDALEIFRRIMRRPLIRHFSWDRGHIEAADLLGLVDRKRVHWYPLVTYSSFLKAGKSAANIHETTEVAFCGNVYLDLVKQSRFWEDECLRSLTIRICDRRSQRLDKSVWDLMLEEINKLPLAIRAKYGLRWDKKPFWDYYIFVVWHAANTLVRLDILSKVKGKVGVYGLFADPQSRELIKEYPNLDFRGNFHHFEELPRIYASSKINICISNGLNYKGIPSKLIDCVASGGFALTDPKEDLGKLFGRSVERIFFRNVDELNEKIEYFLCRPSERKEIVSELQKKIRQYCSLRNLFDRVVASVDSNGCEKFLDEETR